MFSSWRNTYVDVFSKKSLPYVDVFSKKKSEHHIFGLFGAIILAYESESVRMQALGLETGGQACACDER